MSLIRPELRQPLARWREAGAAAAAGAVGLWIYSLGGWLFMPVGAAVTVLAIGWAVIAVRRLRFLRGINAPGVVEVDEGQVGYLGPSFGGFVALSDLAELRLTEVHGARQWRLRTAQGDVLLIPADAAGAEHLYDAFASLPGIDMAAVAAALDHGLPTLPLWRRGAKGLAAPDRNHDLS